MILDSCGNYIQLLSIFLTLQAIEHPFTLQVSAIHIFSNFAYFVTNVDLFVINRIVDSAIWISLHRAKYV